MSILSERRVHHPYGIEGGEDGETGLNLIIYPDGRIVNFGGKNTAKVPAHTRIRILTPGGGGYGNPKEAKQKANVSQASKGLVGSLQLSENKQSTN